VIGAGGSARAVGVALARAGAAAVTIANRTRPAPSGWRSGWRVSAAARGRYVRSRRSRAATGSTTSAGRERTPAGLGSRASDPHAATPRRCLFVDLVYARRPTPFLAAPRAPAADARRRAHAAPPGRARVRGVDGRRAPRAAMARALRAAGLALTEPAGA
jgi:shikimate 5-dehydrogenase